MNQQGNHSHQNEDQQYHLTLLRHGESEGNVARVMQGKMDLPLTDIGYQQAHALAQRWKSQGVVFDHIISSPLQRAHQTANAVAKAIDLSVEIDDDWIERGFGVGEGFHPEVVRARNPGIDFHHPYLPAAEGGESSIEVYQRILNGLLQILRRPPGRYLIVSHGAALNMAFYAIMGLAPQGHQTSPRFRFGNTAYANWSYNPESRRWFLLSFVNPEDWIAVGGLGTMDKI